MKNNNFFFEGLLIAAEMEERAAQIIANRTKVQRSSEFINDLNYVNSDKYEGSIAVEEYKTMMNMEIEENRDEIFAENTRAENVETEEDREISKFAAALAVDKKKKRVGRPKKETKFSLGEKQAKYRIEDIKHFSAPTRKILLSFATHHKITFLSELTFWSASDLLRFPGMKTLNIREIKTILQTYGMQLGKKTA